jgi:hypothetical protein
VKHSFLMDYARKLSAERGVSCSIREAEEEIVSVIRRVSRSVAPSYRFGYLSNEDIEQQGVYEALLALEDGDYLIDMPLENFMHVHIRNRLSNFRRKHYKRIEAPCKCCDPSNPPEYPCRKWLDWSARNATKANLMHTIDVTSVSDESEANMRDDVPDAADDAIGAELRALVDRELPVELRRDYLQMLDGRAVPKARREKVRAAIIEILNVET